MKKLFTSKLSIFACTIILTLSASFVYFGNPFSSWANEQDRSEKEGELPDGAAEAAEFEFRRTVDPALGYVPTYRLWTAIEKTAAAKERAANAPESLAPLVWTERGPDKDTLGPSNANGRGAGMSITSGRIRAIWVDLKDVTQKTILVGGASGGLWKTTDFTPVNPTWTPINDKLSNLSITGICQSPLGAKDTFYLSTGDYFGNSGRGVGVLRSVDDGKTWTLMPNSSTHQNCTKIICDPANGYVYLGTNGGLYRSINQGVDWEDITPAGLSDRVVSDLALSSTGRLHVCIGYRTETVGSVGYRYTDNPSSVMTNSWTAPATAFVYPLGNLSRCAMTCLGNTLYVSPSNAGGVIDKFYKSIDGGANWSTITLTPANILDLNSDATSSQGWYSMGIAVDPSNADNVIVGNFNTIRTTDGGMTWTKITDWAAGGGLQYLHADIQDIRWFDNGNKLLIADDGGLYYSSDKGTTVKDRNTGLRIKQFTSCAIHPTANTDYFIGGTQDNGSHQLKTAGLAGSVEVHGGDGGFVAIDKNDPQYQFASYTFSVYYRSTNGGANWGQIEIDKTKGLFVNPYDYDPTPTGAKIYASTDAGKYMRWDDAKTGMATTDVPITALGAGKVSAVTVSPYTSNLIYLGSSPTGDPAAGGGAVIKVTNAESATPVATKISSASMPSAATTVSCVGVGTDDQNLVATYSNYGVGHVWVTTNGGTDWTKIDGNLPDMPVRWAVFAPGSNTQMYIATQTGVWETAAINGASTVWVPSPSFPNVRTDMVKIRASDRTIIAATYGRGFWTATLPASSVLPVNLTYFKGKEVGGFANLSWHTESEANNKGFDVERSYDGLNFTKIGFVKSVGKSSKPIDYSFVDKTPLSVVQYYRLKQVDTDGKFTYSKTIFINLNGKKIDIVSVSNPFSSALNIVFNQNIDNTATVQLYDLSGRLVYAAPPIKGSTNELNVAIPAQLSNGLYIVKINVDKQQFTKKVMKL